MQVEMEENLQDRKNMTGHVTSSFLLLNPSKTKILLIHHKGLNKWLCPGGHYEGEVPMRTSAIRELEEETGFPLDMVDWWDHEDYVALDIDSHIIPPNPTKQEGRHYHHDFLYVGIAKEELEPMPQAEEVFSAKWASLVEVASLNDSRMRRLLNKVIDRLP